MNCNWVAYPASYSVACVCRMSARFPREMVTAAAAGAGGDFGIHARDDLFAD